MLHSSSTSSECLCRDCVPLRRRCKGSLVRTQESADTSNSAQQVPGRRSSEERSQTCLIDVTVASQWFAGCLVLAQGPLSSHIGRSLFSRSRPSLGQDLALRTEATLRNVWAGDGFSGSRQAGLFALATRPRLTSSSQMMACGALTLAIAFFTHETRGLSPLLVSEKKTDRANKGLSFSRGGRPGFARPPATTDTSVATTLSEQASRFSSKDHYHGPSVRCLVSCLRILKPPSNRRPPRD